MLGKFPPKTKFYIKDQLNFDCQTINWIYVTTYT